MQDMCLSRRSSYPTDLQSLIEVFHHADPLAGLFGKLGSLDLQCLHFVVELPLVHIGLRHPRVGEREREAQRLIKTSRGEKQRIFLFANPSIAAFSARLSAIPSGFPARSELTPGAEAGAGSLQLGKFPSCRGFNGSATSGNHYAALGTSGTYHGRGKGR